MEIEPLAYYEITPRGEPPEAYRFGVDGRTIVVPADSPTVQASESVEPPGDTDETPTVLHIGVLRTLAEHDMLTRIED